MGFAEDQSGGASALFLFRGKGFAGLNGHPGAEVRGRLTEHGDDLLVDAVDPDQRVRQIDHRGFGGVEAGQERCGRTRSSRRRPRR